MRAGTSHESQATRPDSPISACDSLTQQLLERLCFLVCGEDPLRHESKRPTLPVQALSSQLCSTVRHAASNLQIINSERIALNIKGQPPGWQCNVHGSASASSNATDL